MSENILIALISLATAAIGAFAGVWFGRKKVNADSTQTITQTALLLIDPLKDEVADLREGLQVEREINRIYRDALDEWRAGFDILDCQFKENGMTPRWAPSPIPDIPTRPRKAKKADE